MIRRIIEINEEKCNGHESRNLLLMKRNSKKRALIKEWVARFLC